jgi:hypothetical protein
VAAVRHTTRYLHTMVYVRACKGLLNSG